MFNTEIEAVAAATDMESAIINLVEFKTDKGECLSSGEVVTTIRTHRTDLRFSHAAAGQFLRDHMRANVPTYTWVKKMTTGKGRTPAGVEVFIYGPDVRDAMAHDFEKDIPVPGVTQDGNTATQPPAPAVPVDMVATIQTDARVCVPKAVLAVLSTYTGIPVAPGDTLHVLFVNGTMDIRQQPHPGSTPAHVRSDDGRMFLSTPGKFKPSTKFPCTPGAEGLILDFNNPKN